jgi:hypothetical protein
MLSLEDCRKILGEDAPADDSQLEQQREAAYRLAHLLMDLYRAGKPQSGMTELPKEAKK